VLYVLRILTFSKYGTSLLAPGDPGRLGTLIYLLWKQDKSVCVRVHMCVYYTFVVISVVGVKTR